MSTRARGLIAGRYRLRKAVGDGGMGAVWEAQDQQLDRPVAIKVPDRRLAAEPSFVERFRREARAAARLSHPNVAQVYDYGVDRGQPYLVMEFVPGETLASRLTREGPVSSDEARRIGAQAADALHAAHDAGVVHRDVKPGNIMVTPGGQAKVLDFGIAAAAAESRMTGTGIVLGTPTYMAPEQAAGEGATSASDIYSLGVVLYEMLAGRPPFEGDSALAVASAHVHREPEPLERAARSADPDVVAAIHQAMAKEPSARPASAAAFAALLRGEAQDQSGAATEALVTGARPTEVVSSRRTEQRTSTGTEVLPPAPAPRKSGPGAPTPSGRGRRRGLAGWIVAVAALIVLGILFIVLATTLSGGSTRPSAPPSRPSASVTPSTTPTTPSPSPSPSPSASPSPSPSPSPSSSPSPSPSPSVSSSGTGGGVLPTPSLSIAGIGVSS